MKKFFILPLMAMFITISANAQQENKVINTFLKRTYISFSADAAAQSKGYEDYGTNFEIGWKFAPAFYAFASCSSAITLYDKDGLKDHFKNSNLGGGLGFRLFTDKMKSGSYDIKASITTTVGSSDWKNTTYDAGIFYRFPNCYISPRIGLGYRFYDSRITGIKSHGGIYASIGFSL